MNTRADQNTIDLCNDAVDSIPAHIRKEAVRECSGMKRPTGGAGSPSRYSAKKADWNAAAEEYAIFMAAGG